ncbi:MAG: hypothetical protein ACYSTT_21530 [Planctomycetota bacterium]
MSKAKSVKKSSTKKRKKSSKKTAIINEPPAMREDAMQETNDIPKFDLAKQIMAEHRKITAIRRKGPAKNAKPSKKKHPAELIAPKVVPGPTVSGPQQIIAEIVARDIKNLCVRNTN